MKHILKIIPAISVENRHKIQDFLGSLGYDVIGGGTDTDLSECSVSFDSIHLDCVCETCLAKRYAAEHDDDCACYT